MNETIKSLINRKSCRSFTKAHVDKALIDSIIEAGLNAPSGRNFQTPRFLVVRNDDTVKRLSMLNAAVMGTDSDPFYGAPDLIAVLAKREGTYIYDGSLAMGNLLNAAYSLGLGAIWIHRAREVFDSEEGKEILRSAGISEDVEGIGFCAFGYVNEEKAKTEIKENRVFYI